MGGLFSSESKAGSTGPIGPIGPIGPSGPKGDSGDTVLNLSQVLADPVLTEKLMNVLVNDSQNRFKGQTGAIGPSGVKGDTGAIGPSGAIGPAGVKGDTGAIGPSGVKGDTGAIGPSGVKGDTGDKGDKGDRGDTGTFSLEQVVGSALAPEVRANFFNTISSDTRFKGPTGPTGPTGPSGSVSNIGDLSRDLLGNPSFVSGISGGIVKTTDFNTLNTDFTNFKSEVKSDYLKASASDADWWNTQLKANYTLYDKPEIKSNSEKSSAYVWNNFYTRKETDDKFQLKGNYVKSEDADLKYAKSNENVTFKNIISTGLNIGTGTETSGKFLNINSDGKLNIRGSGDNYIHGLTVAGFNANGISVGVDGIIANNFDSFKDKDEKTLAQYIGEKAPPPNLAGYTKSNENPFFGDITGTGLYIGSGDTFANIQRNGKLNIRGSSDNYIYGLTVDGFNAKGISVGADGIIANNFDSFKDKDEKTLAQYIGEKAPAPVLTGYAKFNEAATFTNITGNNLNIGGNTQLFNHNDDGIGNRLATSSNLGGFTVIGSKYKKKDANGTVLSEHNPTFNIFSRSSADNGANNFVLETVTHGIGPTQMYMNPKWGGNVYVGYNPVSLNYNGTDLNIPDEKFSVKGNINASGNIISSGLKLGNWNIAEEDNKLCFTNSSSGLNMKKCFGEEPVLSFDMSSNIAWNGQPWRTFYNTSWRLGINPDNIVFTAPLDGQGGTVKIWVNLSDYSFTKVKMEFQGHRARLRMRSVPAPYSTENKKELFSHDFPSQQNSPTSPNLNAYTGNFLTPSNMPTKIIYIEASGDGNTDNYFQIWLKKLWIDI